MDKALRNAIIFGILLVSLSFSYYLVIFTPKNEDYKRRISIDNNIRDNSGYGSSPFKNNKCCN